MSLLSILSFAAAMFVLALTPGPGVFAVLGSALNSGFKKSLYLIAGIVSGDLIYLGFALSGLTWLAQNVSWIFSAVRIGGGLYLIFLGLRAILSSRQSSAAGSGADGSEAAAPGQTRSSAACYLEGLIITLSNPKVILFYCSFLPAFMDLKAISGSGILAVALIVSGTLSLVMTAYSCLAVRTGKMVQSENGIRRLNKGAGVLMITAGSFLALKR